MSLELLCKHGELSVQEQDLEALPQLQCKCKNLKKIISLILYPVIGFFCLRTIFLLSHHIYVMEGSDFALRIGKRSH